MNRRLQFLGVICIGASALHLVACDSRVKTHPDPDVRIQSMRKVLDALPPEGDVPETRKKKKEGGGTDAQTPAVK